MYESLTNIELYVDGADIASQPRQVLLTYDIEVEWRSWGIKGINVSPTGVIEFDVEMLDVDTLNICIDMRDVEIYWVKGHSYVPESLMVRVDKSGKLLEAELSFYFQSR